MTESVLEPVALFPALGRFGSLPTDCLDVSIDACIREIRLVIPPEHGRTFLNLRRLEFYSDGSSVPVMPDGVFQQSSIYNDDAKYGPGSLFEHNGIHSKSEVSPWWSMTFREPQTLKSVRVLNTRNMWGVRSWPLQVHVVDIDGNERCVYAGRTSDAAHASLKALSEWAPSLKIEIGGLFCQEHIRADLFAGVLGILEDKARSEATPWRLLMELVDSRPGANWTDRERELAAAFLLAQYESGRKTSVNSLGGLFQREATSSDSRRRSTSAHTDSGSGSS
ncbi:MAG: hypothetical protein NVV67_03040 [Pseudoxanthomonas sp.]|nr:hypothetical protein [Pseudoxanthomonas sp.]